MVKEKHRLTRRRGGTTPPLFLTVASGTAVIVRLEGLKPSTVEWLRLLLKYEAQGPITPFLQPVLVEAVEQFVSEAYAAAQAVLAELEQQRGRRRRR